MAVSFFGGRPSPRRFFLRMSKYGSYSHGFAKDLILGALLASGAEEKQRQEEEPESIHEVPVIRSNLGGYGKR
jgi:hypothetical protein